MKKSGQTPTTRSDPDFYLPGVHTVHAALQSGAYIQELWVAKGKTGERLTQILQMAAVQKVPVVYQEPVLMDRLAPDLAHQGILALAEKFSYRDLDFLIRQAQKTRGNGLLLAADHITDEGNLGALIRTAASFGVQGLILPKDRSAQVSAKVLKRSSGAHVFLPMAQVVNLGRALDELNQKGFWIIGAAGEGAESIYEFDWRRDLVLVLGSEDKGIKPIIRERCHALVRIPTQGFQGSLNVAVAGGVILAEVMRRRSMTDDR